MTLLLACAPTKDLNDIADTADTADTGGTADTADTADTTDAEDTADTGGPYALSTCVTSMDDAVPDFYRTFFRCVTATAQPDGVLLQSEGLPPHPSPYYPPDDPNWVAWDDRGGAWHQNPNEIAATALLVPLPDEPTPKGLTITADLVDLEAGTSAEEYRAPGMALDGTALFHGVAAPGDDISTETYTFDLYEGHPQEAGVYHHHSPTPASLAVLVAAGLASTTTPGEAEVELYGVMCDGTVVLGCTELDGSAPVGELDAQRGHLHEVVWATGSLGDRYHTHLCAALDAHVYTPEVQFYEGCAAPP